MSDIIWAIIGAYVLVAIFDGDPDLWDAFESWRHYQISARGL